MNGSNEMLKPDHCCGPLHAVLGTDRESNHLGNTTAIDWASSSLPEILAFLSVTSQPDGLRSSSSPMPGSSKYHPADDLVPLAEAHLLARLRDLPDSDLIDVIRSVSSGQWRPSQTWMKGFGLVLQARIHRMTRQNIISVSLLLAKVNVPFSHFSSSSYMFLSTAGHCRHSRPSVIEYSGCCCSIALGWGHREGALLDVLGFGKIQGTHSMESEWVLQ